MLVNSTVNFSLPIVIPALLFGPATFEAVVEGAQSSPWGRDVRVKTALGEGVQDIGAIDQAVANRRKHATVSTMQTAGCRLAYKNRKPQQIPLRAWQRR